MAGGTAGGGPSESPETEGWVMVLTRDNYRLNLVVRDDYAVYVEVGNERVAFSNNALVRLVALGLVVCFAAYQVGTALRGAMRAVASTVDGLLAWVYRALQYANAVFASETAGTSLRNVRTVTTIVKRVLVTTALLLFLLDWVGAIDAVAVPKWFFGV